MNRNCFEINDKILFVKRIHVDSLCGSVFKNIIVAHDVLWEKEFKHFFAACVPTLASTKGKILVLMPDATLRDITIMLPYIWEERKKKGLDND